MNTHLISVLRQRINGIPRSPSEMNYSLQMLSIMRGMGWHSSIRKRQPLDGKGFPTPWYTDAALEWLTPRVQLADSVFEFGAGYSTVWYGKRVRQVVSVEHDPRWLDQVRALAGSNVTLLLRSTRGTEVTVEGSSTYYGALDEYPPKCFDVIVVDGMERVKCASAAFSRLCDDGIIIFDNSDRPSFRPGIDCLHEQGFGRIDFYGFVAQSGARMCTSIFSRYFAKWSTYNVPLVPQGY
jgi:protein-L-isoaspartate O-methyltransferase